MKVRILTAVFVFLFVVAECSFAGLINLRVESITQRSFARSAATHSVIHTVRVRVVDTAETANCLHHGGEVYLTFPGGCRLFFDKQRVETGAVMDSILQPNSIMTEFDAGGSWLDGGFFGSQTSGMEGISIIQTISSGAKHRGRLSWFVPLDVSDSL